MLLTKIPFFHEVVVMSFSCGHCGHTDNSLQNAGEIQMKGSKYSFTLHHPDDMERNVIVDVHGIFRIEELDIELPAGVGQVTNLEGLLSKTLKDLESGQKARKTNEPDVYEKIDALVQRLIAMMIGRGMPFTVTLDDPSGNSWIEPSPQDVDTKGKYLRVQYPRTTEQNASLGLGQTAGELTTDADPEIKEVPEKVPTDEGDPMSDVDILRDSLSCMEVPCPGCAHPTSMNMQSVNVPYFKETLLCALNCENCGYRDNDVKTGGEVPEFGKRITLHVNDPEDLRRDLLKSESCAMYVPECKVQVETGTMGGRFTTVEGILTQIRDDLEQDIYHADDPKEEAGDSASKEMRAQWESFFVQLDKAIAGKIPFTIIMTDPLDKSYIQSLCAPEPDPKLTEEQYERTAEEMEDLGLADMKTQLGEDGEYEQELPAKAQQDNSAASTKKTEAEATDIMHIKSLNPHSGLTPFSNDDSDEEL